MMSLRAKRLLLRASLALGALGATSAGPRGAAGQDIELSTPLESLLVRAARADVLEAQGNLPEALGERRLVVEANPDDASLDVELAVTLVKARLLEEAERALLQARRNNPRDARVDYSLGVVEVNLGRRAEARAAFAKFLELAPSSMGRWIGDARQRLATLQ